MSMAAPSPYESMREFLTAEQNPMDCDKVVEQLIRLAAAAPGEYPKASEEQWQEALAELVKDGLVSRAGRRVAIIRQPVASKRGRKGRAVAEDSGFLF